MAQETISRVFPDTESGNRGVTLWYTQNEAKGYRHESMEPLPLPKDPETGAVLLLGTRRWRYTMRLVAPPAEEGHDDAI